MIVDINGIQKHFLQCACNLRESILDFRLPDQEFIDSYGYTKKEAKKEIDKLYKDLKD